MPKCIVVNVQTNEIINRIIATETDPAPEGCKLIEIPDGYFWDKSTGQLTMNIYEVIDTQETLAYGY
jgi:hypothetical protein